MKRNPTPENRGVRSKVARADSRSHPQIAPKPGRSDQFSQMNSVSITEAEILRTAEAIRQAGCRDVLIISTPEYIRFVVTIKLPKPR
jgi:hypothetical protein